MLFRDTPSGLRASDGQSGSNRAVPLPFPGGWSLFPRCIRNPVNATGGLAYRAGKSDTPAKTGFSGRSGMGRSLPVLARDISSCIASLLLSSGARTADSRRSNFFHFSNTTRREMSWARTIARQAGNRRCLTVWGSSHIKGCATNRNGFLTQRRAYWDPLFR